MNIQKVGIVGAGTMGQSLAEAIAGRGFEVILLDKAEYDLENAKLGLERSLSRRVTKRKISDEEKNLTLSRIVLCTNLAVLKECHLVIESIAEDLQEKIDLLQEIEEGVAAEAVFASSTSTLSITEIAAHLQHPERMIGLHIHAPVQDQALVEVVRGLKTASSTVEVVYDFIKQLGKNAVCVHEAPGNISLRLMMPLINDAVALLAEGVASACDIDQAMKSGYGFTHGPLELADQYGIDALIRILQALFEETADPRYKPHPHLRKMARARTYGVKSGVGFYRYDEWGERSGENE